EVRPHDGEELQDDRRADVRHDAEREDRHARQVPAREHVVVPEHRVLQRLGELRERARVDARRRDVTPHLIHAEEPERVQHAIAEIRDGKDVLQAVVHASCSVAPPAAAIFSAAFPLNLCARTVSAFAISPRPSTLILPSARCTSRCSRRSSGVTTVPASNRIASVSRLTTSYSTRNGLWNPRFGTRRWSGIWPPSNPRLNLNPDRDFAPLCPRPAVLPCPEPWPRPMRFFECFAPLGGRRLLSDITRPRPGDGPCGSCRAPRACPSAPRCGGCDAARGRARPAPGCPGSRSG